MSSAVPAVRRAVVDLLRDLFPAAGVTFGPPVDLAPRMAWVGAARIVSNEQPTYGGAAQRSRDEQAELDVVLSCFSSGDIGGMEDVQQTVYAGAYEMFDALEAHFRDRSASPLVPTTRLTRIDRADDEVYPATEPDGEGGEVVIGWICDVTVTISTTTRL